LILHFFKLLQIKHDTNLCECALRYVTTSLLPEFFVKVNGEVKPYEYKDIFDILQMFSSKKFIPFEICSNDIDGIFDNICQCNLMIFNYQMI